MKIAKKLSCLLIVALMMFSATGCYFWRAVEPHQFAILSKDGVTIDQVVGEGRYTDSGYRADIHIIDGQGKTLTWRDDELLTSDRQTVGFEVSVTYARDVAHVELMWTQFRTAATNDEALAALVESRLPRVVKAVTSSMTLDQMLERTTIQATLRDMLTEELSGIGLRLIDVGVNNIRPTSAYLALLEQRATIAAEEELAQRMNAVALMEIERERNVKLGEIETQEELAQRRNTLALAEMEREKAIAQGQILLAQDQLALEKAETEVALELARRGNLVAIEESKVFAESKELLQIRLAEIHAEALSGTTTVYLPADTVLNIFDSRIPLVRP
jgi:hypothetical protein